MSNSKIALFPGSFDPYTVGHHDILCRALPLFDKIVIAIGINRNKKPYFPLEGRLDALKELYKGNDKIEITTYSTLTTDLAKTIGAQYIIRGVSNIADYEYELTIADVNRNLDGIETILFFSKPELSHISSSIVRELHSFGRDITGYLPVKEKITL